MTFAPHTSIPISILFLRSFFSFFCSFFLVLFLGSSVIKKLQQYQEGGQPIRDFGPKSHLLKKGTPTMGGILLFIGVLPSTFLFVPLSSYKQILPLMIAFIGCGIVGLFDDIGKLKRKSYKGVPGRVKLLAEIIIFVIVTGLYIYSSNVLDVTNVLVPYFNFIELNVFIYFIFCIILGVGSINAVNITDGLDGLASMIAVTVLVGLLVIILYTLVDVNIISSQTLNHASNYASSAALLLQSSLWHCVLLIPLCSLLGALLGFLWFNSYPASIFMGDTGSLALGGFLGALAIGLKVEFFYGIMVFVFFMEIMSVMMQVTSFHLRNGKRIFKMSPIHHHFEQSGWPETKIVARFFIVSCICVLLSIFLFFI